MRTLIILTALGTFPSALAGVQCTGNFAPISAAEYVKNTNPGWNLGNTLDAVPNEGSWNNPVAQEATFDDVKKAGFRSVRLPVTWTTKIGPAPDYKIDPKWLDRVATVLDQITSRGLYAIVNVHHDSWEWFDFSVPGANVADLEQKFSKVWSQIGTKLACTSNLVAFEPINEPKGTTKEHGDIMNGMNDKFLEAINGAGGFNPQRVVTLVGLGEDSVKTSQWFKRPDAKWKNPWALQYHFYSPYDFIFSAWGKTTWGSDEDKQKLDDELRLIRQNFTDIPLIIGEWAASPVATEPAARWHYFDHFIRTAAKYNTSTMLWDNGGDFLDRTKHVWRDDVSHDILISALKGVNNSLPMSSTDVKAPAQNSSAFIFHKAGQPVVAQLVEYVLNGNTVKAVLNAAGSPMTGDNYKVNGSTITFTPAFLETYFSKPNAAGQADPGVKSKLKVQFSAGAASEIQLVQWNLPTFTDKTASPLAETKGKDLLIPVAWKGINKVAAVRGVFSDGSYIADDWTKWIGPLQAGYLTFNNHWNFDDKNIVLKKDVIGIVAKKAMNATFTVDFWPREAGNNLNYTLLA